MTASADHVVVDRRRITLVEPGLLAAPIHDDRGRPDDDAMAALVAQVRASIARTASAALEDLTGTLPEPIGSISLRAWPLDFPHRPGERCAGQRAEEVLLGRASRFQLTA